MVAETDTHRFPQVPISLPLDLFPLNLFVFVALVVGKTTMNQTRFQSHAFPLYGSRSGAPCVPSNATRIRGKAMA